MRIHILLAGLVVLVPLAAGCGPVRAQTAGTAASRSAVIRVAGNCPASTEPMRPAPAVAMADLNGDGYICPMRIRSIAGDILRLTVDNDAAIPDNAPVLPEPYIGM